MVVHRRLLNGPAALEPASSERLGVGISSGSEKFCHPSPASFVGVSRTEALGDLTHDGSTPSGWDWGPLDHRSSPLTLPFCVFGTTFGRHKEMVLVKTPK